MVYCDREQQYTAISMKYGHEIRAWMSNHISLFHVVVITYLYLDPNDNLASLLVNEAADIDVYGFIS